MRRFTSELRFFLLRRKRYWLLPLLVLLLLLALLALLSDPAGVVPFLYTL